MKYSCTRLAPKHDVADAEAAEQWPRKEADEAYLLIFYEGTFVLISFP